MFGELLRELRKDRGMTQAALARELSFAPLTISAYERGRSVPDDATKVMIARIFNISLDYLLGLIREPLPYERSDHTVQCPQDFGEVDFPVAGELYADFGVKADLDALADALPETIDAMFLCHGIALKADASNALCSR